MKFDYENLIVDKIFNDDEIAKIYSHINNAPEDKSRVVDNLGQKAYFVWLPEDIVDVIVKRANEISDVPVELRELSFATYIKDNHPRLHPHLDTVFFEPRLTLDIQVGGNISWPISVEGREYTIENNQALTFSGTHQIHWRPKIDFKDGEHLDMIFCHFSEVGATPNTLGDDHYLPLDLRCVKLLKEYNES